MAASPEIAEATPENIARAADLLRVGKLVAFPTETVYGLGASIDHPGAIRRIYEVKGRPATNPLIVHVDGLEQIFAITEIDSEDVSFRLAELGALWPGPLTVVLKRKAKAPAEVSAGRDTVAIRVPKHKVALELISRAGPLAAPSANPSGYISPTSALHVAESLGSKVDLILDGGECGIGLESTVVSLLSEPPKLLRPGGISAEKLQTIMPGIDLGAFRNTTETLAPGMLPQHYSPHTALRLKTEIGDSVPERSCFVSFSAIAEEERSRYSDVRVLSEEGNLEEVAAKLFGTLRDLDKHGYAVIIVDVCKEEGLGLAIMDRLRRAAAKR